ncbi:hypothetical protein VAEKB19_7240002 [Vibrio aestuarianus]|nr:hypothetical protein VAEKB19_7240002 [Vibrio aestuarianus]
MSILSALTPTSFKPGGVSRSDMERGSKLADSVKNVVQYQKLSREQKKHLNMVASYGRASEYKKAIQQKVSGKLQKFEVPNPPYSNNKSNNHKKIIHTKNWESKASFLLNKYNNCGLKNQSSARSDELKSQIVLLEDEIKSVKTSIASLQGQTDPRARSKKNRLNKELINLNHKKSRKENDLKLELMKNTTTETFYNMTDIIKEMAIHLGDRAIPVTNSKKQDLVNAHRDLITKKDEYVEAARRRR